jgi:alpha-amylase
MLKINKIKVLTLMFGLCHCFNLQASETTGDKALDPFWQNAVVYFAMTDRFYNGDTSNDMPSPRKDDGTLLRGFHGGDIRGLIDKIKSGYFKDLGVQVLWMTPLIENIHGPWIDEWGTTYGYHGYWAKDWTNVDPNFGTEADVQELIETAHQHNMRVMLDVVINHVGPPTTIDPVWPEDWVRRSPTCDYKSFAGIATCTMVPSLPDVITEKQSPVALPDFLIKKWQAEGRLEQEMAELDAFFVRSGYPRTPQHYIIKWLTDWVRDYGADGFRVDTAKHVEAAVWRQLKDQAVVALADWRSRHPQRHNDDLPFYMVGEVMEWGMLGFQNATDEGRAFDFGDMQVDFFDYGFDALINMGFSTHANQTKANLFDSYATQLHSKEFLGKGIINYVTSHDDMGPFDRDRSRTFESATKLMLAPGAVQITFGDELARNLIVPEAIGDEWLRTPVDWSPANMQDKQAILHHWQKLGQFRAAHLAVGAGEHQQIAGEHFVFSRILQQGKLRDAVVVALDLPKGEKQLPVGAAFKNGTILKDYYSGQMLEVINGLVKINNDNELVLLAQP